MIMCKKSFSIDHRSADINRLHLKMCNLIPLSSKRLFLGDISDLEINFREGHISVILRRTDSREILHETNISRYDYLWSSKTQHYHNTSILKNDSTLQATLLYILSV